MNEEDAKAWLGHRVSRETFERLETYHDMLQKWQRTVNLVAPATLEEAWGRHFVDSAQMYDLASDTAAQWLDLGSGGGFPGLVVAALGADANSACRVTLVESDIRKCGFLREVARKMGVTVNILSRRISDIPKQAPDIISARALSDLPALINHSKPHLATNTQLLFAKGHAWREEVETLPLHWQSICEPVPSVTHPDAVILRFDTRHLKDEA